MKSWFARLRRRLSVAECCSNLQKVAGVEAGLPYECRETQKDYGAREDLSARFE